MRARASVFVLVAALTLVASRGAAQDPCHDDAEVRVTTVGDGDGATADALSTLLGPGNPAAPTWELVIAGPRTIVRHVPSAEHFARTLAPNSTAYDRALASIELLNAARAAACTDDGEADRVPDDREPELPDARADTSLGVMAGVRFDADPSGPWMIRPTLHLDLGLLRGGGVHLVIGLQASGFGVFMTDAEQPGLIVRYERQDLALEVGGALALGALTLSARLSVGLTVRDVSVMESEISRAHRVDPAPTLGGVVAVRIPLVGPLGMRLSGELLGMPSPVTYRVAGERVITESDVRLAGSCGLDLEL